MKSALVSLAIYATVALGQALTINTPSSVVVCEPSLLSWSGGTGPYIVSILPGNSPSSPALESLGQQTGTSVTWKADIAAGTSIGLTIRDSTGATASSAPFSVQSGSDTSCLNGGGSSSSGSSSSGASSSSSSSSSGSSSSAGSSSSSVSSASSSSAASPSVSSAASTSKPATTATTPARSSSSGSSSSGGSTTTGASGSSSTGNAASANMANLGVAGAMGAAVMAILA